jgi:hypothetical protein
MYDVVINDEKLVIPEGIGNETVTCNLSGHVVIMKKVKNK